MNRRTRTLLVLICGVAVASVYASQPVIGQMGVDLGVPAGSVGWFVAVGQLGYLLGLIFLVPLGDLIDRRQLIVAHLIAVAAGLVLVAAAPAAWVAFAGIAITGVFAVVVQTAVAYAAAVSAPAERGHNLGIVTSGVVVGILGGRILAGFLADVWGWRSVFIVLAVFAATLVLLMLLLLPDDARPRDVRYGALIRSFAGMFFQPVFFSRGVIAFFLFASFGALWSGMTLPLTASPWHLNETQVGLFGIAGLAGAIGAARAGSWADAGSANRLTGIALVILLISWLAIGQLPSSLILLIVGVILLDFAVQATHVSNQHLLTSVYADRTSTTIGAYMVFYSLGSALGAATTTALYDTAGWAGSALLGAAFAVGGLSTWALNRRTMNRVRPTVR
ncbi:MFS transporter [Arthrobacter sp. CAN_C5]|uniref:MFS transporter n=1 Tax=Arthrobacter sp. CAN_C5 TaxID=2760706 RepID=UPI001AE42AFB|nr:MFS transporter [Arthrobacter sp. CAN_C5]MBP2217005.1 putative MFS family arabinose efflux permease [Arthrobacter sp. CAN_C5]